MELAIDDVGPAVGRILSSLETVLREEPPDERGGLRLRALVRGDRRETAVLLQELERLLRVRLHSGQHVGYGHRTTSPRDAMRR